MSSVAKANQRCAGVGSGGAFIHRAAVLGRFVLGRPWARRVAFEVGDARNEHVVWCGNGTGSAAQLHHFAATISKWRVVEHHEEVDVGVRAVGTSRYGTEENDPHRVKLGNERLDEFVSPGTQRPSSPDGVIVTHGVRDVLHSFSLLDVSTAPWSW